MRATSTADLGPDRRLAPTWWLVLLAPVAAQLILSTVAADAGVAESALGLFWLVVVAASLCAVAAMALIARGWCTGEGELALTGGFFFAMSVLPLAHGVTTPGVIFGDNPATMVAVFIAIPVGLAIASPLVVKPLRRWLRHADRWRSWVAVGCAIVTALAVSLVAWPHAVPAPAGGSPFAVSVGVLSLAGCAALSYRHLCLARIAGRFGPLVVGAGYAFVGATALVWLGTVPYSAGYWVAHGLDITGVLLGAIGGVVVFRRTDDVRGVFASVVVADPLDALEVGLDPVVHRFVADLEAKDEVTRDHVVRTAALAVRVGEELGFDADEIRVLGLAAILHDVGKLEIPDEILNKPGRLDDAEYDIIKTHTSLGADMVAGSAVLVDIADGVRSHHERMDGAGYPDGLVGDEIPRIARVVAVCDAFDAMAHTRQYRDGMGAERALSILREHAGSQWDETFVDAVDAVVGSGQVISPGVLDGVGRHVGCDCLPDALAAELEEMSI